MKEFLPPIQEEKMKLVFALKNAVDAGEISLETARERLKKEVKSLKAYEIAYIEQNLKQFEDDECRKEDIQAMLALYEDILDTSPPELPQDHPIARYYAENAELKKLCLAVEDLVQYPVVKNQWYELYEKINEFKIHLSRKQNQLYPLLEKKGFDRPTTTMWTLDNFIRDEISDLRALLDQDEEDFIAKQATMVADLRDLMSKEETVLYPTSLAMISAEEFEHMKLGDAEIGFAWLQVEQKKEEKQQPAQGDLGKDLEQLLAKYGLATSSDTKLSVTTGNLTLEQINLLYQHMPVDFSYVDEHELVAFYTDSAHRIFPRSRNVIGRNVMNCHPRASAHLVREIIDKFRSGEQNTAEFWINKPGLFIYIYYVAVRDQQGNFRGVLEMMQDCTRIRSLEGSQTLLSWSKGEKAKEEKSAEAEAPKDLTQDPQKEEPQESTSEDEESSSISLTPQTRLADLLQKRPSLKTELASVHPAFKMLQTPLARVMIPKATIAMMADRSGMDLQELIQKLDALLRS